MHSDMLKCLKMCVCVVLGHNIIEIEIKHLLPVYIHTRLPVLVNLS